MFSPSRAPAAAPADAPAAPQAFADELELDEPGDDPLGLRPTAGELEAAAAALRRARDAYEAALPQLRSRWLGVLSAWARAAAADSPEAEAAPRAQALQLARQGVPPALRGVAWFRAVGNALSVDASLYETCVARAEATGLGLSGADAGARALYAAPAGPASLSSPARVAAALAGFGSADAAAEDDPDEDAVAPPMLGVSVDAKFMCPGPLPVLGEADVRYGRIPLGGVPAAPRGQAPRGD